MRSSVGAMTSGLVVVLMASVALAGGSNYKDSFVDAKYTGSNGTLEWPGETPWIEVKDDGSPTSGKVQALSDGNCPDGSCLAIRSTALTLEGVGASRAADLSVFADATLKFKMNVVLGLLPTDAMLMVQGWDGAEWQTIASYGLVFNEGLSSRSIPLASSYLDDSFQLRYLVSGLLNGDVYLDYVELAGTLEPTTTSSTTTSPTSSTTSSTVTTLPVNTTLPKVTTTTIALLSTTSTKPSTSTTESTTTTAGDSSDTTTTTSSSTSEDSDDAGSPGPTAATTTTTPHETSTTDDGLTVIPQVELPDDPGLRRASIGLQVGYQDGRLGEIAEAPDLLGVAIEPSYALAAEVFESSWVYLLVLLLVIATAIVSGIDRRRLENARHSRVGRSTWFTSHTG